ncbi:Ig-like domain-containing protein [Paenarthrobacter sp. NPDC058040]|uniref:Ig-like domain-containing protein n=1 Tax=unclassified Paenarthrobacter TaxID=2634190 RepID=UPI0036DADB5B
MKTELRELLLSEAASHIRTHPADMERALDAGMDRVRGRALRWWAIAIAAALVLTAVFVTARVFLAQATNSLESVAVAAPAASLRPATTVQLSAEGTYSDGSRRPLVAGVVWASENPAVAVVAVSGEVTALSPGSAGLTATYDGVLGRIGLTVTAAGDAQVTAVRIVPESVSLDVGGKVQFTALGSFSDGSIGTLGPSAIWISDHPAIAQVDGNGLLTAIAQGVVTVTASDAGFQGTANITVKPKPPATLTGLVIDPSEATLKQKESRQFTALASYSDGSTEALADVTWSTGDPKVATVTAAGLVTGQSVRQVVIAATHVDGSGKQWRAESKVTVEHAVTAVVVGPTGPHLLEPGATVQLKATVSYSDGLPGNATVTWASSRPIFVTVNQSGLARGAVQGEASITATVDGVSSVPVLIRVGIPAPTPGPAK